MHQTSYDIMGLLLKKYAPSSGKLLDVGSYDVNGSYRELVPSTYTYTGLDISAGENVDIVVPDLYKWPIPDNSFDLVISGQCLEHVEAPWLWIQEIYRICKNTAIIIAPWSCGEHRFPVDCWRILPDGMRYLLGKTGGFNVLECGRNDKGIYDLGDTWGVGHK